MVCTLEPCSHHGRTPPCADALVAAGVARVVIGAADPLERDRAQGREVLRAAGIEVAVANGADAEACAELNAAFLTWALTGLPHVTLKLATSLDGKIATAGGESQWISGPESRALVHRWRADHDAVGVGLGTAIADDPRLTARDVEGPVRQPARVVFDSAARLPLRSALVHGAPEAPADRARRRRRPRRARGGARGGRRRGRPAWRAARPSGSARACGRWASAGIQSLLVEGGAELAGALRRRRRGGPRRLVPGADADRRRRRPVGDRRRRRARAWRPRRGSPAPRWSGSATTCW